MKSTYSGPKRILSCLLVMLLLSAFPATAMAADEGTNYYAVHLQLDEDGQFTYTLLDAGGVFGDGNVQPATPAYGPQATWTFAGEAIDLWPTSSAMRADKVAAGTTVPYVKDTTGNTWYLQKIQWANTMVPSTSTTYAKGDILSPDEIEASAGASAYTFDPSEIEADPCSDPYMYPGYYIWYGWTQRPPEFWDSTDPLPDKLTISYDLNLPINELEVAVYPVVETSTSTIMHPGDGNSRLNDAKTAAQNLSSSIYEGRSYTIPDLKFSGDETFVDFLVFKQGTKDQTEGKYSGYYDFAGWKVGETTYQIGDTIDDLSEVADASGNVEFKAVWENIESLSEDSLQSTANDVDSGKLQLPLNLFSTYNDYEAGSVQRDNILLQWVNGESKSDAAVVLDKDDVLNYEVVVPLDTHLTASDAGASYNEEFINLTVSIDIDEKLKFLNTDSDGTVTITVDPGPMTYQSINIRGAQVSGNNITFDPNNLAQLDKIEISFQWFGGTIGDRDLAAPIKISGLTFQLAESAAEENDFTVESSANVTGKVDFSKKAMQQRFYYQAAWDLIYQRVGNDRPWLDYFGTDEEGNISYTTALVHALQYMDYRMADINLSEKGGDNSLKAEPVAAIMVEPTPVTLTPADMTIYMGGDGGYDAVVDENGQVVESANSLPHPIFQLTDAPDGVAFNNAVFTNADSGNTWKLVSETGADDYYHFENEGSTEVGVRVQYSDGNDVVTSDKFEPETEDEVYKEYTVSVYKGDTKGIVTAVASDGKNYLINTGEGKLTVRAVAKDDPTSDVEKTAPTTKVDAGKATAVEPEGGTTYTLNNTDVVLPADSKPSLLFDEIITSDGKGAERITELKKAVDEELGAASGTRNYEIKYLDLVDANNGNAWISSSAGVDIYWGYPAGTDSGTEFTLLHFAGLHRDATSTNGNTGFDPDDIAQVEPVKMVITREDNGIRFHVDKGGFSPFVLVWEVKETSTDPDPDPGTTPGGGNQGSDYTLYYHSNFGDDKTFYQSDDERTMEVRDYEDMSRLPDREGYEFVGWNTEEDGSGDDYAPGDEFRMTERRAHLYAMWERVLPDPDDTGVSRWLNTDDHDAYLSGYPDNTFGPDRSMTRAEVAQMFYALLLDKDVPITVTFSDVPADAWYAEAVNTLASLGMVEGYADGTFRPDNTITRAEFVTIAVGFADLEIDGEARFTDVARNAWYYPYIADACAYGWIGGYPDGSFRPDNTITRAEVTVIVNNMLGRAADERYVDRHEDELRQFGDLTEAHWAWYPIAEAVNSHDYTGSGANERWR